MLSKSLQLCALLPWRNKLVSSFISFEALWACLGSLLIHMTSEGAYGLRGEETNWSRAACRWCAAMSELGPTE